MYQELNVSADELNSGLGLAMHAVTPKPVKPIYSGVLADAQDGVVMLTATDGAMTVRTSIDADVREPGKTVYPARLLYELMRRQQGRDISISVDDRNVAKISGLGSKTTMACMAPEDFPSVPEIENGYTVTAPAGKLKNAIQRMMFAVSTDESRKILTGIMMEFHADEVRMVGIDGFKLAVMTIPQVNTVPGKDRIVVPGVIMNELSKMLSDGDTPVTITYNDGHAVFGLGGVKLYATLLIGEFIDYEKLRTSQSNTAVTVDKGAVYEALERCNLMAKEGKNNLIVMDISPQYGIHLSARAERGDAHEEVTAQVEGQDVKIAFNSQYLMDAIRNAPHDTIVLHFNSGAAPCFIRPAEGNEFEYLVLPVRI